VRAEGILQARDAGATALIAVAVMLSVPAVRADESVQSPPQAAGERSPPDTARDRDDPSRSVWICFEVSRTCLRRLASASAPAQSGPTASRRLDLRPPAIEAVIPQAELQTLLARSETSEAAESVETVEVEGRRPAPDVPSGLLSIPWAIRHPTQAWRIFAPIPSE